jgi:hypothetical protein
VSESGLGYVRLLDGTLYMPLPGTMQADTEGPGGLASALTFPISFPPLIFPLEGGDVLLVKPITGALSDVIRFNHLARTLVFYSDADGEGLLGDTGFPTAFYPNTITLVEGTPYSPFFFDPGSTTPPGSVTYVFLSELPEPGTIALVGGGLLVVACVAVRRRRGRRR